MGSPPRRRASRRGCATDRDRPRGRPLHRAPSPPALVRLALRAWGRERQRGSATVRRRGVGRQRFARNHRARPPSRRHVAAALRRALVAAGSSEHRRRARAVEGRPRGRSRSVALPRKTPGDAAVRLMSPHTNLRDAGRDMMGVASRDAPAARDGSAGPADDPSTARPQRPPPSQRKSAATTRKRAQGRPPRFRE